MLKYAIILLVIPGVANSFRRSPLKILRDLLNLNAFNSATFDSYLRDERLRKEMGEVTREYGLENLSSSEIRAQIKSRQGSVQGLYEKKELINLLSFLIVYQNEIDRSNSNQSTWEKTTKALQILEKRKVMKEMSTDEIRKKLLEGGVLNVNAYRSRDDLESALAMLWLGEIRVEIDSPSGDGRIFNDFLDRVSATVNNVTATMSSNLNLNTSNVTRLTMTPTENIANELTQKEYVYREPTQEEISAAMRVLITSHDFDDAVSVCVGFSKPLIIKLLDQEFNIEIDRPTPRSQLVHLLGDAVMMRKNLEKHRTNPLVGFTNEFKARDENENENEDISTTNILSPQHTLASNDASKALKSSGSTVKGGVKAAASSWRDSVMVPEKELMDWLLTSLKNIASQAHAATLIDLSITRGIVNTLELGADIACQLAEWAIGNKASVRVTLFVLSLATILLRRGVIFYMGMLLSIRFIRRAFFGERLIETNSKTGL